jgi:heterodisulfide reductase subunit C
MRFEISQSALVRQIKRATLTQYISDNETAKLYKVELRSGANIFSRYAEYNCGQCIGRCPTPRHDGLSEKGDGKARRIP